VVTRALATGGVVVVLVVLVGGSVVVVGGTVVVVGGTVVVTYLGFAWSSQARPGVPPLSRPWGSGGRAVKLTAGKKSAQSRSGGGGGMQKSG
jgi:hypothetical protein